MINFSYRQLPALCMLLDYYLSAPFETLHPPEIYALVPQRDNISGAPDEAAVDGAPRPRPQHVLWAQVLCCLLALLALLTAPAPNRALLGR